MTQSAGVVVGVIFHIGRDKDMAEKTTFDDVTLSELDATALLTENATTIGGTNDGNLPDLTATVGADLAAASGSYVQAEASAERTYINALKADNAVLRAAIREIANRVNVIHTALKD